MDNLKPCPFCGGRVILTERQEYMGFIYTKVGCEDCYMFVSYSQEFTVSKKARFARNDPFETAWNRRVTTPRKEIDFDYEAEG